ncbi:unnamed protein product, partial [Clonostachys solani]
MNIIIALDNTRPWCELCKIPFKPGEPTVRSNPDGSMSSPWPYNPRRTQMGHSTLGVNIQDRLPSPKADTYHVECGRLDIEAEVLWSTLDKIDHRYVPTQTTSERRLDWLRTKMSRDLNHRFEKLPLELCRHAAGFCLPVLVSAFSMLTIPYEDPEITSFRVDRDIWARIVKFEDGAYFACLMNTPPPPPEDKASMVVKLAKPEGSVKVLYVAFNHLGIQRLVLGVDDEPPRIPPRDGVWWATMLVDGDTFTCRSDGMKLREMKPAAANEFSWDQCWATPQPYNNLPLVYSLTTSDASTLTRIKVAEWNMPSITGYSVRWDVRLSSIHAHVRGEDDFAFYDEMSRKRPRAVWLYMPMDEGELIEQVWLRSDEGSFFPSPALIMKTNRSRVWEAGPRPEPAQSYTWTVLSQSTEAQRFFFNQSYFGISKLGFQPFPQPASAIPPVVPCPKSTPQKPLSSEDHFYSSAPLDGVVSIDICLKKKEKKVKKKGERKSTPNITGLLFSYQDGRQRSVGHVRLDWLQGPTTIGVSKGIAFMLSEDRRKVVSLKIGNHVDGEDWEFIPWGG